MQEVLQISFHPHFLTIKTKVYLQRCIRSICLDILWEIPCTIGLDSVLLQYYVLFLWHLAKKLLLRFKFQEHLAYKEFLRIPSILHSWKHLLSLKLVFINLPWVVSLYLNKEMLFLWLLVVYIILLIVRDDGLPAKLTFVRQYFLEIAVDGIPQAMRISLIH